MLTANPAPPYGSEPAAVPAVADASVVPPPAAAPGPVPTPATPERAPRLLGPALIGGAVGLAFFLFVFGGRTLAPSSVGWLIYANDASTHFLGWEFFRHEPWGFPLGHVATYGAPTGTNVGMTDSIPLVAMVLKAFSRLLPDPFQYQGLWICLSYVLQGVLGAMILARLSRDWLVAIAGAALLVLSPVLLHRADPHAGTGHATLLAHWVLLAALYLHLARPRVSPRTGPWTALVAATSLMHPYLWVMVAGLLAADAWSLWRRREPDVPLRRWRVALHLAVPLLATALLWSVTGMLGGGPASSFGLGHFSFNLTSPINPLGWSAFVRDRPLAVGAQYEGFSYLGAGVLLLAALALFLLVGRLRWAFGRLWAHLPLVAYFVAFVLLAASPRITYDAATLVEVPLPEKVTAALAVFRSSGRLFWGDAYVLIVAIIGVLVTQARTRAQARVALLAAVALQAADLAPRAAVFMRSHERALAFETPLRAPLWDWLGHQGYASVFLVPPRNGDLGGVAYWAASHRMSINSFYAARGISPEWERAMREGRRALDAGAPDPATLYVLMDEGARRGACARLAPGSQLYEADGLQVVVPGASRHAGWEQIAPSPCPPPR